MSILLNSWNNYSVDKESRTGALLFHYKKSFVIYRSELVLFEWFKYPGLAIFFQAK